MNLIISKSLGLKVLLFSLFKKPCSIEYLYPVRGSFYKLAIRVYSNITKINIIRVKMGKQTNNENKKLYGIAIEEVNKKIFKQRKYIYEQSRYILLNINNDLVLNKSIWYTQIGSILVRLYFENKKKYAEKNNNLYFIDNKDYFSKSSLFIYRLFSIFTIETIRIFLVCFRFSLNFLKNNNNKQNISYDFHIDNLFLSSEQRPNEKEDFFVRNQISLSESISNNKTFAVIDYKKKLIYTREKEMQITYLPIREYLNLILRNIPSLEKYCKINFHIKFISFLRFIRITYIVWCLESSLNARKYILNYYSSEASSLLFLSKLKRIPAYFFQGSLQGHLYTNTHSPYASNLSFTKKHNELYLEQSNNIINSFVDPINISYPYNASLDFERIKEKKKQLNRDFDLSIAYFDEKFFEEDSSDFECTSSFFYEDLKYEIQLLLEAAKSNPRLAIIFKSKYVNNSIINLIQKDQDLKSLYNPSQIFDLIQYSKINTRNLISPAEVGNISDICIGNSWGGTACYEAASVGCRAVLIKSTLSVYDDLLPSNILFNSLDEIIYELSKFSFKRNKMNDSDLGLFNIHELSIRK